ncbi:hypothetical protein C8R43DRAFT_967241 [Mycena crocata]|nr:hypothetical protein C8R43DRAFT_967241 [Mycena crocata]
MTQLWRATLYYSSGVGGATFLLPIAAARAAAHPQATLPWAKEQRVHSGEAFSEVWMLYGKLVFLVYTTILNPISNHN